MRRFLIVLIPVTILFSPILFGGMIFANGDLFSLIYPGYEFYHSTLNNTESFLWNPYVLGGFPFPASILGTFAPVFMLMFKYFSTITAYHLLLFVNVLLGAFFMALLLKELNLSLWAQIVGALTFVASGWYWAADVGIVGAYSVLPLLFLLIWKAREKIWPLLAGGAVVGYGLHTVQYNWLAMILVAAFAFALFLGRNAVFKFLGMAALGTALGLIQFLPSYIYSRFSARALSLSFAESSTGAIGLFDLPRLFLPNFRLPFFPASESLLYFGVLPLFFALLAFGLKDKLTRFFVVMLLSAFLIALKYSPLFWLIHKLPIFSGFRGPSRWMFLALFAASILAAFGVERMAQVSQLWKKIITYFIAVMGVLAAAGALVASFGLNLFRDNLLSFLNNYFRSNFYDQTSRLPVEHYERVIENYFNQTLEIFDFSNPVFLFSLLFLLISLFVIIILYFGSRQVSKQALATVIGLNFILVFLPFLPTVPRQVWAPDSQAAAAVSGSFRTFAFLPGFSEWSKLTVPYGANLPDSLELSAELLSPNINIIYKIPQADAYENLMPRRYARLLALIGSDWATLGEKLSDQEILPDEKAKIFAERRFILDILGIRYITSLYPLDESVFTKIQEFKATRREIPVFIYENKSAKPLAYFAADFKKVSPSEADAYQEILKAKTADPVLWECDPCPEVAGGGGQAELLASSNGNLKLHTNNSQPGLLVFSQNHLPGWKALVDGTETQIYTVHSVFMGVAVPAGEHEVEFKFDYRHVYQKP